MRAVQGKLVSLRGRAERNDNKSSKIPGGVCMKVIILSAGQGSRLLPLTENQPKCALAVAGTPVLEWQLHSIARCPEIDEVVVVTGYATDKVEAIIAGFSSERLRVRSLHNPFFAASDNLGTCWVARHEMHDPFILINGDTLFETAVLQTLLDAEATRPITLTVDRKGYYDDDDMKVILERGRLRQIGKKLDPESVNGESIGMTRFTAHGADIFRAELERSMRFGGGLNRWYLSAIDVIAQKHAVVACCIEGLSWCEIDTHEDIENAHGVVRGWSQPCRDTLGNGALRGA